jgi:Domain of unknown function (DUF4296)
MITRKWPRLCCLILMGVFSGCKPDRPAGILSKDQMVNALTDFYLKEARINTLGLPVDSTTAIMDYYMQQYAAGKNFPDSAIDQSYDYYLNQPLEMSEIYDRVIDSLALREQKAEKPAVVN